MALLDQYYSGDKSLIRIAPEQASRFAKDVATDFNPIHDEDSKRFCVPGDLIFAVVLAKQGVYKDMTFEFKGMMGKGIETCFRYTSPDSLEIIDDNGKVYLGVSYNGEHSTNPDLIHNLTCSYVRFSGNNFPHLLLPLMQEKKVMINPNRPLIIYQSMSIHLDQLTIEKPELEITESSLEVDGKRGNVHLEFCIKPCGEKIGHGDKNLVLSGLRAYDHDVLMDLINFHLERKRVYQANGH